MAFSTTESPTAGRSKRKAAVKVVPEPPEKNCELGICATCMHLDGCMYRKDHRNPIWTCEEFETAATEAVPQNVTKLNPPTGRDTQFQGLCATCANRDDCTLSHARGGVWRCEEYC
ncbi:MAG: hypothetical protein P9L99_07915 [Candidatus Lernaella stagnicola]|nr:hypothetical protein [Candidatus Lernaella stagnicola]